MTETDLDAIALLQDPARRSLYAYVIAQRRDVSRREAAEAVGVQRALAAFHLDRLANAGLLDITYRRLTARSGPGAGRPAKLYRRPAVERAVSLPPRDYARAAHVFADTIERSGADASLYEAARERGCAEGAALARSTSSQSLSVDDLREALAERGYEPYRVEASLRLRNCPFAAIAQEFPVVACGMNLALLQGMLAGGGLGETCTAHLEPAPDECCVVVLLKQV